VQAIRSIPIVFVLVNDPVGQGFISSLARPSGNVTGLTFFEYAIGAGNEPAWRDGYGVREYAAEVTSPRAEWVGGGFRLLRAFSEPSGQAIFLAGCWRIHRERGSGVVSVPEPDGSVITVKQHRQPLWISSHGQRVIFH
jgi:hypothetical protein